MAAVGTPSQQQPPPRAPGFPYPTTLFIHKPNVLHLELRGVRFDVDINILRLFPESVLVGMFSGAGGNAPGGGAQAYPLLALLQSRTSGDGLSGGLSALVGTYARPGQPLGSSGILVPAVSGSPPGSPAQGSRGSAAAPAGEKGQSASDSKPPSPKAASSDASRGPVFVPPSASKKTATAMRWQRFYTADEHDDEGSEASDSSNNSAPRRLVDRRPTGPRPHALPVAEESNSNISTASAESSGRKPSVEKEKHPMAMSSGDGSATEEDRGESEDGGSYEHEEASESSEDLDDYEPQTGIQVLQINFDPRIFGFILEFFQVMLMSIYSGRASSPSPPVEDVAPILTESSSFGTEIDRGEKPLPTPRTVSRMLEPLMTTPSVVTNSRASFVARQPQTIVVVREELDYYVMPEGSMADRPFIFKLGGTGSTTSLSPDLAVGLGKDAIEMQTRVPDEDAGEYFDDEGNPLVMTDEQARIPQRRLFMLALLRRGCGKWLLDRRKIMDCSEPTPGSPMLHHLTTVSDVDATTEWGYREMEVGKCRMVSLAMLKNIEPSLPQTPMEKPSPVAGPLATGRPVAAAAAGPVNNIITQVEEPLPPTPTMMLRRPMRKCWWERRFLKCRIPAGMIDAVEKRAQQWREELEKQDRVHAAEADLMAVIARANPSSKPQGDLPFFNPDDEEQTRLMAKYQEAQADLLAHQQTAPSLARDLGTADGNPLLDDDALGLDIEVEEDLDWSPVSKPRGEPTEQLPGPYNLLLNQEVALRGAPILPNSETLAWYENSEHIVRLWTRRVYTVEYITL